MVSDFLFRNHQIRRHHPAAGLGENLKSRRALTARAPLCVAMRAASRHQANLLQPEQQPAFPQLPNKNIVICTICNCSPLIFTALRCRAQPNPPHPWRRPVQPLPPPLPISHSTKCRSKTFCAAASSSLPSSTFPHPSPPSLLFHPSIPHLLHSSHPGISFRNSPRPPPPHPLCL